jgi:hypothetical protein
MEIVVDKQSLFMDGFYSGTGIVCQWKNDPVICLPFRSLCRIGWKRIQGAGNSLILKKHLIIFA